MGFLKNSQEILLIKPQSGEDIYENRGGKERETLEYNKQLFDRLKALRKFIAGKR